MPTRLPDRVNHDAALRRRGRYLDANVLLQIGAVQWILAIRDGEIQVRPASPIMESWTFALRFEDAAWQRFLTKLPPPGSHDLLALLRTGGLRLDGDLYPFMSHLFWFKEALATLREAA